MFLGIFICFCVYVSWKEGTGAGNVTDEPLVMFTVNRLENISDTILVMNSEKDMYYKIIYRYCFYYRYDQISCGDVMKYAEQQMSTPGSWVHECLSYQDCINSIPFVLASRPPNFTVPDELYRKGYEEGVSSVDITNLRRIVNLLADRQCVDSFATKHYREALDMHLTHISDNPTFELSAPRHVTVPCNSVFWHEGRWRVQPRFSSTLVRSAVLKCPFDKIVTLSPMKVNDSLTNFADIYCEDFWRSYSASLEGIVQPSISGESDSVDSEELLAESQAPHGKCLIYYFGMNWQDSYEMQLASYLKCTVHIFCAHFSDKDTNGEQGVLFHKIPVQGIRIGQFSDDKWMAYNSILKSTSIIGLIRALGHEDVGVDVLKFDSSVVAWEALSDLFNDSQRSMIPIRNIHINADISDITGMDLDFFSYFYRYIIEPKRFKLWYRFVYSNSRNDNEIHPLLQKLGLSMSANIFDLRFHYSEGNYDSSYEIITAGDVVKDRKEKKLDIFKSRSTL